MICKNNDNCHTKCKNIFNLENSINKCDSKILLSFIKMYDYCHKKTGIKLNPNFL